MISYLAKLHPKNIKEGLVSFYRGITRAFRLISRVYQYSKDQWKLVLLTNLMVIVSSYIGSMIPKYTGDIIDAIAKKDKALLYEIVIKMSIFYLITSLIWIVKWNFSSKISRNVEKKLTADYFKKILEKDLEFFDKNQSGDLISILTNDLGDVQGISTNDISYALDSLIEIICSFWIMMECSPTVTAIVLLKAIPSTYVATKSNAIWDSWWRTSSDFRGQATTIIKETLSNIKLVKAFAAEDYHVRKLQNKFNEQLGKYSTVIKSNIIYNFFDSILSRVESCSVLFYGGSLALAKAITPGQLSSMIMYSSRLSNAIEWFKSRGDEFSRSFAACDKVFGMMDALVKIQNPATPSDKQSLRGAIKFEKVVFSYPSKPDVTVLKNVSFEIQPGETIGIVGSSGSGKSTIIGLMNRFYDPNAGKIMFDGEDIKNLDLGFVHNNIGYVPQEPVLFSGTFEYNLTYGTKTYSDDDLKRVLGLANANYIFDKNQFPDGLQTDVGENGSKLSGGQKQRLAIARALLRNPKIMIFDEATSALDAESEDQVRKAVETIIRKRDKTIVMIAHRLSTIRDCNKILVFNSGEIVEQGSHDLLVRKDGFYKKLMDRQLESSGETLPTLKFNRATSVL